MLLSEFEYYNSLYEKRAKRISFHTSFLIIERPSLNTKLKKSYGNFDLFFTEKGLLIKSLHNEANRDFEIIYTYNHKGKLLRTFQLAKDTNELLEITEFIYNEDKRIVIERITLISDKDDVVTEYLHSYHEGFGEIFISSNFEEEQDKHMVFLTFDEEKRIIEDKAVRNENELVWWEKNEYNEIGNIKTIISLDTDGNQSEIYEFFPCINGLTTGYIYSSKENRYEVSYIYEYNERGHWINQVMLNDGAPTYFYDRLIEYF